MNFQNLRSLNGTRAGSARACAFLIATLVSLSGCTSLLTPLGDEYYDCNRKENPASPYCHSFRSAANGTDAPIPDSRYDRAVRISDVDRLTGIAPPAADTQRASDPVVPAGEVSVQRPRAARVISAQSQPLASGVAPEGTPVRVAPLVQRTWVKRHVEQGDRLVGSTYLYKEVTRSHWEGFVEPPAGAEAPRDNAKPHLPDDDFPSVRAATGAVSKTATGLVGRVKSSLSQPGVAAPAGDVVAPPIDGASMPQ